MNKSVDEIRNGDEEREKRKTSQITNIYLKRLHSVHKIRSN